MKKGCKNEPLVKPPKEKAKRGRPKKVRPTEEPLVDEGDIPEFVNNQVDEFEMGESNRNSVFTFLAGRVCHLGKNMETRKKGKVGFVKMRGGMRKSDRLIPTQRIGRMGAWLGIDADTHDTIGDLEPLHAPHTSGSF